MILAPGLSWEYGTRLKEVRRFWDKKNMSVSTASRLEHPSTVGSGPPLSTVTVVKRKRYKIKHSQSGQGMSRVDLYAPVLCLKKPQWQLSAS